MAQRTIDLTSDTHPQQWEAIADGANTPGMLLRKQSTGKMLANAVEGEKVQAAVSVENVLFGKDIDTAYADGDRVLYKIFRPGDRLYAFLDIGEIVVIGDKLVPGAAGSFKKAIPVTATGSLDDEEHIMAQAEEAVDNGTETVVARIVISIV